MIKSAASFVLLLASVAVHSALAQAPVADLLKDVKTVAAPGSPGVVLSLKETISPVVLGGLDKGTFGPVIVAGTWGKGRIVAFGHSGYIDKDNLKAGDTALLMERLARWAAGGEGQSKPLPAGVVDGDMTEWLTAKAWNASKLDGGKLTEQGLNGYRLLVLGGRDVTEAQSDALSAWIRGGGGLLVAQTGWGWQQIKGGPDMRTNALNRLLLDAGIAWTDEIIDKTAKGDGFDAATSAAGPLTLDAALGVLLASDGEKPSKDKATEAARLARLNQASAIVSRGVRILPETDQTTRPRLAALLAAHEKDLVPTEKSPLDGKRPLLRTLMALQMDAINALPPEKVTAHPSAAAFPGAVAADAPRVERTVSIDTRTPRWHSLGLYAPAGGLIKVTVPPGVKGLSARIGSHTDRLWHLPAWKRVPQIAIDRPLKPGDNTLASAFGGIFYIEVDKTTDAEPVSVSVAGCVEAPLFVLGKTSVVDWQKTIRNAPGPWAELAMPSVIITIPSSAIRDLDDPTEVCTAWQSVL
ncbi:MAG: M60 family peptidase N-terminal accessory domain-containing protein, partial [Phycisphaerales bacterium]|nr:M60 family peptidase N-terminal accessory domain-containing protein [Phycisphaerales bacterium]